MSTSCAGLFNVVRFYYVTHPESKQISFITAGAIHFVQRYLTMHNERANYCEIRAHLKH